MRRQIQQRLREGWTERRVYEAFRVALYREVPDASTRALLLNRYRGEIAAVGERTRSRHRTVAGSNRCQAMTRAGDQCKRGALLGEDRCAAHAEDPNV